MCTCFEVCPRPEGVEVHRGFRRSGQILLCGPGGSKERLSLLDPRATPNEWGYKVRNLPLAHLIKYSIECKKTENSKLTTGAAFRELAEEWPELLEKMKGMDIGSLDLDNEGRAFLMSKLIESKLKEKKDLTYSMAFSEVQKENFGLTLLYQNDIAKKRPR